MQGPTVATWYKFLDYKFGTGKAGIKTVFKKMLTDQSCFAPCFLAALVSGLHFAKGHPIAEVKEHLQDKYTDILITNYKVIYYKHSYILIVFFFRILVSVKYLQLIIRVAYYSYK